MDAASSGSTYLSSRRVDSSDGQHYILQGAVDLREGPQWLRAERLEWQRNTGAFDAQGKVRFGNRSLMLAMPAMQGNTRSGTGQAQDVHFRMLDARGNGHADSIHLLGDQRSQLEGFRFSTCAPSHRQWELRASEVEINQNTHVGHARNVTMRLGKVPIFWFPWFRFPTNDARQSGFLYPRLSYSDSRGLDFTLPYYLNLAPNYDATLYPRVISRRGFMLGTEFRWLSGRGQGMIRADYLPHDRMADRSRGMIRARSATRLWPGWRFDVNINHVSDQRYFEDLGNDLYANATRLLHSRVYLSGRGRHWHASIGADRYQITDPDLPDNYEPYKRLPRAVFKYRNRIGQYFEYGIDNEFVRFHKDQGLTGQRLDVEPYLNLQLQGPWWFVRPHLSYRMTRYQLDRDQFSSPSRNLPIGSIDSGLIFERDTRLFGTRYTQTLEPRLFYLWAPYRNQTDIPIFDTSYQTFDFWQLFSRNRFSGPDRQINANNLTLALTTRLLDQHGSQRMSASIGQIRYFDPQRVQLPGRPPTDYSGSAYVAQFSTHIGDNWSLNLAQQWDPNGSHTDLSTVSAQYRPWINGVLNLSYRYRQDALEMVDFSALYPLTANWNLVARWNYELTQNRTLGALAGFEYNSCCMAVRLVGRHYVRNSAGEIDNSILLEIEFKGLGSVGQGTGNLLQRAILGYREAQLPRSGFGMP